MMKLQVSTSVMLLAVACICITLGVGMASWQLIVPRGGEPIDILKFLAAFSPYWLPISFGAYAVGRRRLTVPMVVAFALAEATAYVIVWMIIPR